MSAVAVAEKTLIDAKQQYAEQYGSALVTNTYLRIAVLCLAVVAAAACWLAVKIYDNYASVKPLVIRINDVGRAEAVRYNDFDYKPQEAEIKYFLTQFVHDLYGRHRLTVRRDTKRALWFLDSPLQAKQIETWRQSKELESHELGAADDVDIVVRNVALTDLRQQPFRSTIDYEKVYMQTGTAIESRRERYVGNIVFGIRDTVDNDMIPVNPLGISINYFRADQAFGAQAQ